MRLFFCLKISIIALKSTSLMEVLLLQPLLNVQDLNQIVDYVENANMQLLHVTLCNTISDDFLKKEQ